MERVVITGFALATPAGSAQEAVWKRVSRGECDGDFRDMLLSDGRYVRAGRLPGGDTSLECEDPYIGISVSCSEAAVAHAGLCDNGGSLRSAGITVSSSKGGISTLEEGHAAFLNGGQRGLPRSFIKNVLGCGAGRAIARRLGAVGPIVNCVSACATGAHSIMLGASWIVDGEAEIVIAGSSEASLTPTILAAFERMGVLSRGVMRPFDRRRDGFVPGEGCGIIILEALSSAMQRGAEILCERKGWSSRADA